MKPVLRRWDGLWSKGEQALALALAGWRVFPCREDDLNEPNPDKLKAPARGFTNWQNRATTDPEKIKKWWRQTNYNIGLCIGGTNLVVFDYDMDEGEDGAKAFKEHEKLLPPTRCAKTQKDGRHKVFRLKPGVFIKSGKYPCYKNVDIKGNGSNCYILGAGSTIHGRTYEWLKEYPSEIAMLPDEIVEALEKTDRPGQNKGNGKHRAPVCELDQPLAIETAKAYIELHAEPAEQGGRNNVAYRVACKVKDFGVSSDVCKDLMAVWNDKKVSPPLDNEELECTIDSAYQNGQNAPGHRAPTDPQEEFSPVDSGEAEEGSHGDFDDDPVDLWADECEPPDLPPGLLPPALERWVDDEAKRKGVERGAVALCALVVCAAAVSSQFRVQVKQNDTGHTDRAILWGMLHGGVSARKTPVLSEMVLPLQALEAKWLAEDGPKWRAFETAHAKWKKSGQKSGEPEPQRPQRRRKTVNETTVEALCNVLSDNPTGIFAFHDELSAWIGGMDAYRPGKQASKDQGFWLSAKQGGAYNIDRVTRGSTHVPCVAVHVLGGIQPDVIRKSAPDFSGNGMLQRFLLVCMGPSKIAPDLAPDETARGVMHAAIGMLVGLENNDFVPVFRFSPEADIYRRQVVIFLHCRRDDPDVPPPLRGWFGKIESEWARLAFVLHMVEWATDPLADSFPETVIGARCAEQAARLIMEWQHPHQRHFYWSVAGLGAATDADARNVAGLILARGLHIIAERDIDRFCSGLKREARRPARLAAMRTLEMNGWVRVSKYHRSEKHPNEWRVNPLVHDGRFKERAEAERHRREASRQKLAEEGAARRKAV